MVLRCEEVPNFLPGSLPLRPKANVFANAKGALPGNPLWGDGRGWALFKADSPDEQVATDYEKDCLGCHIPAKSADWIYIQGHPVLKSK
jgi:hypothetical protein